MIDPHGLCGNRLVGLAMNVLEGDFGRLVDPKRHLGRISTACTVADDERLAAGLQGFDFDRCLDRPFCGSVDCRSIGEE